MDKIIKSGRDIGEGDTYIDEIYPALDMNFFFSYVVPNLVGWEMRDMGEFFWVTLNMERVAYCHQAGVIDPNLAWQEALEKLIGAQ